MELDYSNKLILAPMVRAGRLPFRLCALRHGADLVYGEEIIDKKILQCERKTNSRNNTVEFLHEGNIVYRTCPEEEGKNIFQMGSSNAVTALAGATVVARDVAGIDLNMGCPKPFSVSGGMGAALLSKPEIAVDILTTLKRNLPIPITAKIRLLDDPRDTLQLVKVLESTGISAIAIHTRRKETRKKEPAFWEELRPIVDANISIPIIHNGDIFVRSDIERCREVTGATSFMIARGALDNLSIFEEKVTPVEDLVREYLHTCVDLDIFYQNAKWTSLMMLSKTHSKDPRHLKITSSKSLKAICEAFGVADYYNNHNNMSVA